MSAAPPTSTRTRPVRGGSAATARSATATHAIASGALTRRTARQLSAEVSTPPIVGPSAPAIAAAPPIVPSARPRCSGGNAALTIATEVGSMSAPPTPCATRATSNSSKSGASPPTADAPAKRIAPVRNTLRRPSRSPSLPPRTSSPASGSRLQLSTHWTFCEPTWKPFMMSGSAIGTAV